MRRFLSLSVFVLLLIAPYNSWAATTIASELLNGQTASANLNLNDSAAAVEISLTASEPVKWSTIAICNLNDDACSRSTAVKYFTSTSDYVATVVKTWTGQTSAGNNVPPGDYKIKVTVKNAAGEESVVTLATYLIKVSAGELVINQTNDNNQSVETDVGNDSTSGSSAHLSSTPLSSAKETVWQLDLGRERQVLVDQLIPFVAKDVSGAPTDSNVVWSFGDGWSGAGRAVFHRYSRPGNYEVVANGHSTQGEAVARTRVTVLAAEVAVNWEGLDEAGAVVIANKQKTEINLGGLTIIASGTPKFTFPADTLLPAGQKITLESALTHLTGAEPVALITPAGRVLAQLLPEPKPADLVAAVGELNQQLAALKIKLASRTSKAPPTSALKVLPEAKLDKLTSQTPPSTGTLIKLTSQASEHWWQRWLKLIRVP